MGAKVNVINVPASTYGKHAENLIVPFWKSTALRAISTSSLRAILSLLRRLDAYARSYCLVGSTRTERNIEALKPHLVGGAGDPNYVLVTPKVKYVSRKSRYSSNVVSNVSDNKPINVGVGKSRAPAQRRWSGCW